MKGIIFTEFIDLVETLLSPAAAERLLESSDLPSGGIYTSVGTYDAAEIVTLVGNLAATTGTPVPELLQTFGTHLFKRFVVLHPEFFGGVNTCVEFLSRVDSYVHVEVKKLHPDAELPSFACTEEPGGTFAMVYRSKRDLADLAEGMIRECVRHFGGGYSVHRAAATGEPGATLFTLTPTAG